MKNSYNNDLTIHILGNNPEKTIESVGDFPIITNKDISETNDRSEARRMLCEKTETDWCFYLNAGETILSGHEYLHHLSGINKKVFVVHGDLITKELRIWRNGSVKFENPVYETITPDTSELSNIYILSEFSESHLEQLLEWQKSYPNVANIDYYLACEYLKIKNIKQFFLHAERFLFKSLEPSLIQKTLIRYYMAQVHLHDSNPEEAIKNLICCLSVKPLMAEFWCGLADCYYKAGQVNKAYELYRNGLILGADRDLGDDFPIQISKYKEYPERMIDTCKNIISEI